MVDDPHDSVVIGFGHVTGLFSDSGRCTIHLFAVLMTIYIVFTLTLIIGLAGGGFVASASARRSPLRSGLGGRVFHYLASASMTGAPVAVLSGLLSGYWVVGVLVGLGCLAVCAISLLIHAAFERRATAENPRHA